MAAVAQTSDNPIELQQQGIRRRAPRQYPGDPGLLLNKTQHRSLLNFLDGPINITGILPFPVNSKYAKPLETPELLEVAHVSSRLECQILAFVRVLVEAEAAKTAYTGKNTAAMFAVREDPSGPGRCSHRPLPVLGGLSQRHGAPTRVDSSRQCTRRSVRVRLGQ
jgi:hypothetical protein